MERNKFGGNCYLEDINSIMSNNARRAKLNYSHKQENRWNMWTDNGGMTLSFVLNRGLFIPSISGVRTLTLEKFYFKSPSDVDSWVRADVRMYLETVKRYLIDLDAKLEQEGYEKYIKAYYESIRMIDEESDVQRYNRLNNEFLTEEEYRQMYPEPIEELKEEVDSFTKVLKPRRVKKSKEVPGQLSLFDYMDGGKTR